MDLSHIPCADWGVVVGDRRLDALRHQGVAWACPFHLQVTFEDDQAKAFLHASLDLRRRPWPAWEVEVEDS